MFGWKQLGPKWPTNEVFRVLELLRLLPVKSSAPHRMTSISPTGKSAAPISLATRLWNASPPAEVARMNTCAPKPMNTPASMPSTSILPVLRFAFLTPLLIQISAISAGELTPLMILLPPNYRTAYFLLL